MNKDLIIAKQREMIKAVKRADWSLFDKLESELAALEKEQETTVKSAEEKDRIDTWLRTIKYQIDTIGNGYADVTVFEKDRELFESILLQFKNQPHKS
jgi:hypothetical protein